MFSKETYMARRAKLKQTIGSGLLLFLGNDESGMNYADNTYHFRQDSTFLYFFGLPYAGLSAIIDIDNDKEIIFGDELTIDAIVWMGTQPTLKEKSEAAGIKEVRPFKEIETYLKMPSKKASQSIICRRIVRNTRSSYSNGWVSYPVWRNLLCLSSWVS